MKGPDNSHSEELVVPSPNPPPDDTVRISPSNAGDEELLRVLNGLRALAIGKRLIWHRLRILPKPECPAFGASGWLLWRHRRLYHILACEARGRGLV